MTLACNVSISMQCVSANPWMWSHCCIPPHSFPYIHHSLNTIKITTKAEVKRCFDKRDLTSPSILHGSWLNMKSNSLDVESSCLSLWVFLILVHLLFMLHVTLWQISLLQTVSQSITEWTWSLWIPTFFSRWNKISLVSELPFCTCTKMFTGLIPQPSNCISSQRAQWKYWGTGITITHIFPCSSLERMNRR